MDTVLVVVIAGVIIAAIAGATLSGGPKPATTPRRRRRAPAHRAADPAPWVAPEHPDTVRAHPAPPPDPDPDPEPEPDPEDRGEPDLRRVRDRVRAAGLLAVTVVLLGAAGAGLLGAVVLLGYRALDRALG